MESLVDIIVYTLPACINCTKLKEKLTEFGVAFTSKDFDVNIHTDLIMKNNFSSPPILVLDGKEHNTKHLFVENSIDEKKLNQLLGRRE